jgi:hypothetical protein
MVRFIIFLDESLAGKFEQLIAAPSKVIVSAKRRQAIASPSCPEFITTAI